MNKQRGDGDVLSLIEQLFSNMDVAALLHCHYIKPLLKRYVTIVERR